jgi:hypothetical protein
VPQRDSTEHPLPTASGRPLRASPECRSGSVLRVGRIFGVIGFEENLR